MDSAEGRIFNLVLIRTPWFKLAVKFRRDYAGIYRLEIRWGFGDAIKRSETHDPMQPESIP